MKTYLGDSVYIEFDHEMGQIVLTTENGMPEDPSNVIVIGPEVWESMKKWIMVNVTGERVE